MYDPKNKLSQCEKSLYGYLCMHAEKAPDRAFCFTADGMLSYGDALKAVRAIAADYLTFGIKRGDLVALRATRSVDTALLAIALFAVGAVAVMCDAHFGVKQYIADCGVDIRPAYYLTNERENGGVSASGGWVLQAHGGKSMDISTAVRPSDISAVTSAAAKVTSEDLCMIIFTSGSTGKSKAVMLSHRAVVANPVDAMPLFKEDENDVAISLLPLNHVFGFAVVACAVFCGHSVVFPPETDADTALEYIQKYGVSCIYIVPTYFLGLLSDGKHKKYDISSLRLGLMAGGPFTESQLRFIEGELGIQLMPGYGMSECVGIATMSYGDPVSERAAGVGRSYPMTEIYILDGDGNELPVGEVGEICVKGKTMMSGYYADAEGTAAAFDGKNRLHTGDIGYLDASGILHINGRKKDIIIRGGENISAVKIERALLCVAGVYQAAAVGIAHEVYGETPCAAVVPERGATIDESYVKRALGALLSKHEIPERIAILKELPLTSSGKPNKQKIKDIFNK